MSEIDEYVRVLFFRNSEGLSLSDNFVRASELVEPIKALIDADLEQYGIQDIVQSERLAGEIFTQLEEGGALGREEVKYAGTYYMFHRQSFIRHRASFLASSTISSMVDKIGEKLFADVFSGYKNETSEDEAGPPLRFALGSDRVVSFTDNQTREIEGSTDEIIGYLEEKNQVDGPLGFREVLIGQLKAGRELVRAGCVKLYLLELTLINSLAYLVKRYEREVIGGAAAALLTALAKHIGIDA